MAFPPSRPTILGGVTATLAAPRVQAQQNADQPRLRVLVPTFPEGPDPALG